MLKVDWKGSFDWNRVVLNLRHAKLSYKKVHYLTGIHHAKIRCIAIGRGYTMSQEEANKLMDLHYKYCLSRHNDSLKIQ